MKRREVLGLIGGTVAYPLAAWAQQPALPVIVFLRSSPLADAKHLVTGFRQGLTEAGFIEGQNVTAEYHSAEGQPDRLPPMVADLIRRSVTVIVGDTISALAAKAATSTVPIVFSTGGDPVQQGLVASLNRPGGNVTGVSFFGGVLGSKRLELLRQLVPDVRAIAMFGSPDAPATESERRDVQTAAQAMGQQIIVVDITSERDIETAFATSVQRGAGALIVGAGAFFFSNRERLAALAARHTLPTIYVQRETVVAGGLMSYGTSLTDAYRQVGTYAARILKGEKPADLPVMQATKFEFVLNLKTARTLGLEVPDRLLALADEVIE